MLILAFAVLAGFMGWQEASRPARVDAVFKDYDSAASPGCAVGVFQDGAVVYKQAYGMANLDHDVRLSTASVFHVASVSKQFTAAAILLLAQDGKLTLDDDIRRYLPELPDFGRKITIRHLANHTSGIRDQWDLLGVAGWRYSRDLITDDDVLELLGRQKDLNFTPGERHLYSNSGYTLLAVIVSRVSGKSFREFTNERIFAPLGMASTHFRDRFTEIVKNQAYGYAPEGRTFRLSVTNFDTAGATSLLTTVEDMARWNANLDTGQIDGDAVRTGLLERGVLNDGQRITYALGMSHGTYRGLATVGHGGSDAGYRADFVRFPSQRLGVATLCNAATANPGLLGRRVAEIFLPAGVLTTAAQPTADDSVEVPLPSAQLARFAGLYWNDADNVERRVVLDADRLHIVLGSQRTPLKSLGSGAFVMTAAPWTRMSFEEKPPGKVQLRAEQDLVLVRMEPFTPTAQQLEEYAGTYRSDEMDTVFRISTKDGRLQLVRSKLRSTNLDPLFKDAFRVPSFVMRFTRNPAGRVTGFQLEGGRVRHLKFWKDTSPRRPSTVGSAHGSPPDREDVPVGTDEHLAVGNGR
jgi:CubicO group peptidase (beta-lactamase class C family)